jgi:chitodextrinase
MCAQSLFVVATPAHAATTPFAPTMDARVKEATPTTNYGTGTTLQVDAGSGVRVNTYLRFNVTGLSGTVQSATLRLMSNSDGTSFAPSVYAVAPSPTWNETEITWANQPGSTGPASGGGIAIPPNTWAEWDVKALVTGNGTYNFVLITPNTDGVYFISREGATASRPQLVVTTGTPADTTPPTAPTNLSGNASSSTQIDLTWTGSTDNVGVTGYNVYRWTGPATPTPNPLPAPLATVTTTSYSDTSAAASSTYNYLVKAKDAANNLSADSNTATVTTPPAADTQAPTAPTNLSGGTASSPTQVDLTWTASTDNVGVTGYNVYRWTGPATPTPNPLPAPLATVTTTSYSDTSAAASSTYNYLVKAKDAANNLSADSNTATVTTPPASTTVTANPIADAKVQEQNPGSNFATTTLQVDAGSGVRVNSYLRFTINGLSGAIQSAKLRALATSDGTSFGPSVSATNGSWTETGVTWSNQPGPTGPSYGGATAIPPNTWAEWDVKPLVTGNGTYNFVLTTPNTDGIFFSSREDANTANRPQLIVTSGSGGGGGGDITPPTQPTGLTATAVSSSQINLAWTASTDNVGVSGYDIYRGGTYLKSVTTTSTSDTGLAASTTYTYYVIARDAAGNSSTPSATASATTQPSGGGGGDPTIGAAGDIACDPTNGSFNGGNGTSGNCRAKYTSDLLVSGGYAAVLNLGDNQYYCGGYSAFTQSYDLSWGRVKGITHPSVGNHEYLTSGGTGCDSSNSGAAGYFRYFGSAAGQQGKGYYSYDVGSWHLIALNSNCGDAGGCSSSSAQYTWLQSDLNAHTNRCVLAYWHIPLYSSGGRAASNTQPFWNLLYNANADVILSAHDHIYERFAPQNASAGADSARGIREFLVGTGGANHTSLASTAANSQVRDSTTYGVLKLTLHSSSYDWQFVRDAASGSFTDSGSGACH